MVRVGMGSGFSSNNDLSVPSSYCKLWSSSVDTDTQYGEGIKSMRVACADLGAK